MAHRIGICGSCRSRFQIPAAFAPKKAKCRSCGGVVEIGPLEGQPEPVLAAVAGPAPRQTPPTPNAPGRRDPESASRLPETPAPSTSRPQPIAPEPARVSAPEPARPQQPPPPRKRGLLIAILFVLGIAVVFAVRFWSRR